MSKKIVWALIIIGCVFRVNQYLANRSLWIDEVDLALNIINTPVIHIFEPFKYDQAAIPTGFFIVERVFYRLFGGSELSLRFLPLIFSLISIGLFYKLTQRYLKEKGLIIAMILFVFCDQLIYFASEVKQYSLDVLIVLMLYIFFENRSKFKGNLIQIISASLIGTIIIWSSHPAIFVVGTLMIVWLTELIKEKNWKIFITLFIINLFWLANLYIIYKLSIVTSLNSTNLINYWDYAFAPFPIKDSLDIRWYQFTFFNLFNIPLDFQFPQIGLTLFLIGIYSMMKKNAEKLFIFILPLVFVFLASIFHFYPLSGRLLLFLVPGAVILIAEGGEYLLNRKTLYVKQITIVFIIILLFNPVLKAGQYLINPRTREETKLIFKYLQDHRRKGDTIYLYYATKTPYIYYAPQYGLAEADAKYLLGVGRTDNFQEYGKDLIRLKGKSRVWVIFSHVRPLEFTTEEKIYLAYLNKLGKKINEYKSTDASIYLYNFSR